MLLTQLCDVVKDVGRAIDDYVIQPILDDPLSAIATVAAASFLGPAAAAYFGTSASVGVGIAAGAANTAAGLVQGEDFGDAVKGGLMAGVGAGVTQGAFDYFGGPSAAAVPDEALAGAADDPLGSILSDRTTTLLMLMLAFQVVQEQLLLLFLLRLSISTNGVLIRLMKHWRQHLMMLARSSCINRSAAPTAPSASSPLTYDCCTSQLPDRRY
jgi:hypothetical protein